jgi:hypothetical protein
MRVPKDDVEVRMEIPGAVIRQRMDFGDVRGFDTGMSPSMLKFAGGSGEITTPMRF